MQAQLWISAFFALLAIVYGGLALTAGLGLRSSTGPAQRAHRRVALIFAAVSLWLFLTG